MAAVEPAETASCDETNGMSPNSPPGADTENGDGGGVKPEVVQEKDRFKDSADSEAMR